MLKLSNNLSLPIDFVTERIAFLARTGAGKSGGMRVLFEELLAAKQFVVFVDPKGDAWGIRASGKLHGYPVLIMGGDHADVPLQAAGGKSVAEFLVKERISTVLDISDFGKADMVRFVTDLAATLYRRNRDVMHVFLDEADMVAGERFFDPRCLEAIQMIQNKGRHRGFGVTVASQRSAMINKSVLTASGTLVAMQTTGPRDIKAVREWLEVSGTEQATKLIVQSLPTLKPREAFVYSPQHLGPDPIRITFREFKTFDSMRTPKPGETRQQPKTLADINISSVQRDLGKSIEETKANDPAELKRRIAELQRQVAGKTVDPNVIVAAEARGETRGRMAAEQELKQLRSTVVDREGRLSKIEGLAHLNGQALTMTTSKVPPVIRDQAKPLPRPNRIAPRPAASPQSAELGRSGDRRMLIALAQHSEGMSDSKLAILAGLSKSSGTFGTYLGRLRSNGWAEGDRHHLRITDEGVKAAGEYEQLPTGDDLIDYWRGQLGVDSGQRRMFDALIEAYPQALSKEDLAAAANLSAGSGTFGTYLGKLRTLQLVEGKGEIKAADVFFE